jgi:hypothetical protein
LLCFCVTFFIQAGTQKQAVDQQLLLKANPVAINLPDLLFENDVKIILHKQPSGWFMNFEGHFKNAGNADANNVKLIGNIKRAVEPHAITEIISRILGVYWPKVLKHTSCSLGFGQVLPKDVGPGKYTATLILDPDNTIAEINEHNNRIIVPFEIKLTKK